jgi:aspartate/methionine/tyrosine aminotransferase
MTVQERRDFLHKALSDIPGVRLPNPDGAFYMMPDVSAFIGPHAQASGFGAVPDVDALCRCIIEARWSWKAVRAR